MKLFYTPTDKDLLKDRNRIFIDSATPQLYKNNFIKSPFSTANFGKNNLGDFTYEFIRLKSTSELETLTVHISKGDKYIKFYLNIFELKQQVQNEEELKGVDSLKLALPPLSLTKMRLRSDDYKFIPLITVLFYKEHKLARFFTKKGYNKQIEKLSKLITQDCSNIDKFARRWHVLHSSNSVSLS